MRLTIMMLLAVLGLAGLGSVAYGLGGESAPNLRYHAYVPGIAVAELEPTPTPTSIPTPAPRPPVYEGPVASLYLGSARINGNAPVQELDTNWVRGREVFQDPTAPQYIATYPRYGKPGYAGANTMFAAHVNYVHYGNGPFAYLHQATVGDALYITMGNGETYAYTVKSVDIVHLDNLDMDPIVFPALDSYTERVTLISCGGTFIPAAVGGEYTSRVIVVAERYVP